MLEGKKIMVVEDEALLALDLAMTMEDLGAAVIGPCYRLGTALELVQQMKVDGAILDVDLNGETVFPLARYLDEQGVPFVFHTGRADPASLLEAFARARICTKPSTPERIATCLAEALADADTDPGSDNENYAPAYAQDGSSGSSQQA
ncbi:response regulator [Frigidibacter mobilis]|uniref:Response regulator receiver n=1 Tax=Frigidibacter mobilis TaxID=1335048 RepID=A0A159Z2F0_9RHOB|nr:response regulator [Frigidibacter mobilis]AMY68220.1 response regulator receiver [Frigidibacter mobilis]